MMLSKRASEDMNESGGIVSSASLPLPPSARRIWNMYLGSIVSIYDGRANRGCRIKTPEGAVMRIVSGRHAFPDEQPPRIGQLVRAKILMQDVRLAPHGYQSKVTWWNQWSGRVVLVDYSVGSPIVTIKIRGESWTIRSTAPVYELHRQPVTGDGVTILIDPAKVRLTPVQSDVSSLRPRLLNRVF